MPMQSAIIIVMGITSIVIHFTIKHDFILTNTIVTITQEDQKKLR
jgi:hypothetical protein